MMSTGKSYEVVEVGVNTSRHITLDKLEPGDVGFVTASIKNVKDATVGIQ